ncbi:MAG: hypothetical protein NXY57DRAFT_1003653 [Lentinula lateritia]|uniref:F-box domain-containing protein n=1 Tax=Lentinula lateritia TaxID=40482 RepID=A0ABQ8V7C0_9AGAR|nr:MAG: hypothetical protein NXY57DRAFT_1003653 [Lentinula lateritia]KAJ4478012.1 hypothetical protein C8R41DRAFT_983229 [Lentinula lateritia]
MASKNPTIQNSPHELLRAIFATLTPGEVAECALVCKVWSLPARGRLYEHIDVRKSPNKMTYVTRSAMLCQTLDATPALRSIVHSLCLVSHFPSTILPEVRAVFLQYAAVQSIPSFINMLPHLQNLDKISFHTNISLPPSEHLLILQAFGKLPLLRHMRYFAAFPGPVRKPSQFIQMLNGLPPQRERGPQLLTLDLRNITELGSFRASLEDLEWTFHPRSPLDLTHLRALSVSTYRAAKYFMREVSGTLESLTFTSASRILGDTESQPPITLPAMKYLCIPSETIDISLIANIHCPYLECITLIWQTETDLDPEFMSDSESPLFLIDRCITNRSNYPILKEIMVLVNEEASGRRTDVSQIQKMLPRCTGRAINFELGEWQERDFE